VSHITLRLPLRVAFAVGGAAASLSCMRPAPRVQVARPLPVDTASSATAAPAARLPVRVRTVMDDPFARLDRIEWPGPNAYRAADGTPGPMYWQQRADYTIAATLDTTARAISGSVTIRYTNNSPDTLRVLWLQLEQNLYRPGSIGSALFEAESRWGVRGFRGGYDITNLRVNGRPASGRVDDTMMSIPLDAPLAPNGAVATIAMNYTFRVPDHGSDRMGRDSTLYEMAQWYPRMAVYDEVRGWNTDPYIGQGEFYLEYGDFEYSVTAPAGYVIAGTGVLQNRADVLTPAQRERLDRAARSSSVVQIVTADESRPRATPGTKTWRFRAQRVRDVAWAAAPDFRWDATSWNGILTQAYYPWPRAGRAWESGAEQTQWSIRTYSELLYPYPYPQATSVAGTVGGMEYPMFVMVHYGTEDPNSIFGTIDHEQGHEWFPMIVGSNERRYAWQDEGFNTYINAFSNERRYPGTNALPTYMQNWRAVAATPADAPLMTPPDRIDARALGALGYRKPAAVLIALRNHVVGRDMMDRTMREYVRRWAYKHPTPGDFFRTMENITGDDLAWFWRGFFYTTDVLDIGIDGVTMRQAAGQQFAVVALSKHTSIPFPVALRLRLADGSTQDVTLPVNVWTRGDQYEATLAVRSAVTGARLWPDATVPDFNAINDVWGNAPPADTTPSTAGGLAPPISPIKP
jgi:peptidase M1-like protein